MAMMWKEELSAAVQRLTPDLPLLHDLKSMVVYAESTNDLAKQKCDAGVTLAVANHSRSVRQLIYWGDRKKLNLFARHANELSDALDHFRNARIGQSCPMSWTQVDHQRSGWKQTGTIAGGLTVDLISWTLALHDFAKITHDVELLSAPDGMGLLRPDQVVKQPWYPKGSYRSVLADPASVSHKFATWMLNTVTTGICPVELFDEATPPLLMGRPLSKPLAPQQYEIIKDLIAAGSSGRTESELRNLDVSEYPRHVLLGLMGLRDRRKEQSHEQLLWSEVILNPGKARLGWRLKFQ